MPLRKVLELSKSHFFANILLTADAEGAEDLALDYSFLNTFRLATGFVKHCDRWVFIYSCFVGCHSDTDHSSWKVNIGIKIFRRKLHE